ncbi:MAG: OmpH family outer membrane protein [Chitinophagales bacterium]|nr:OmpH family outer membrane protein [Chitinophagales bacterium]
MKKILLVFALVATCYFSTQAQMKVNKFGYINSLELLAAMPESAVADQKIEDYGKALEQSYTKMVTVYQEEATKFEEMMNDSNVSDATKQVAYEEVMELQKKVGEFEASISEKMAKKREEHYTPIINKANEAIKAVAKANGYTYIFDTSVGCLVYADETDDVIALVKKQLGI